MLNVFDSLIYAGGVLDPAVKFHVGYGYDPEIYISTAGLAPSPYLTQALCAAKLGGANRLIEALCDTKPPINTLNPTLGNGPNAPANPVYVNLQSLIEIITLEINGYLASCYPMPLGQTGTVAVFQVTELSTDGNNSITAVKAVEPGNYLTAPAANQSPVYLEQIDPLERKRLWQNINVANGSIPYLRESGTGAEFTLTYAPVNYSDEGGVTMQAQTVTAVAITNGGSNYQLNDLLVPVGGSSFVPAIVRNAALEIFFYECYKRRLAPDETNPGTRQAKFWRDLLVKIRDGESALNGTYKRAFSPVSCWSVKSVLNSNSL